MGWLEIVDSDGNSVVFGEYPEPVGTVYSICDLCNEPKPFKNGKMIKDAESTIDYLWLCEKCHTRNG